MVFAAQLFDDLFISARVRLHCVGGDTKKLRHPHVDQVSHTVKNPTAVKKKRKMPARTVSAFRGS